MRRIIVFACGAAAFFAIAAAPSNGAAPANDDLRSAQKLNQRQVSVSGLDLTFATTEPGERTRNHCGTVSRTVWYRARSREWSAFRIDAAGSRFPLVMTAFWDLRRRGGSLVEIACATNEPGDDGAFTPDLPPGDYLVQVGVLDGGTGAIGNPTLNVTFERANPDCAYANIDEPIGFGVVTVCGLSDGGTGFIGADLYLDAQVVLQLCGASMSGDAHCHDWAPTIGGIFAGCNSFVQTVELDEPAGWLSHIVLGPVSGGEAYIPAFEASPDARLEHDVRHACRPRKPRAT